MENRFMEYLESAIDKAEQAVSSISYSSYPEINKEVIAKWKMHLIWKFLNLNNIKITFGQGF